MPLETATYVSDLVTSNPAASDGLNNADDHMRLIKAVLKNTFPGTGGTKPITSAAGTLLAPVDDVGFGFASEPTLGFKRKEAGVIDVVGGNLVGALPIGALVDMAANTVPYGFLYCDGSAVSRTTYAKLFAVIGTTWGSGNGSTTFNLPDAYDRYRRSAGSRGGPVGNKQEDALAYHTHNVSGTTGNESSSHTHSGSGQTAGTSHSHRHDYDYPAGKNAQIQQGTSYLNGWFGTGGSAGTTLNSVDHTHGFSFTTGSQNSNHTHTFNVTSGSAGGDTETRPKSLTVLTCIRAL